MNRDFIIEWNNKFRYDYWWRKKYKVAFNSEEHRAMSQIDIRFDYEEEMIMREERANYLRLQREKKFLEKTGKWLKTRKMTEEQAQAIFDRIDISDYGEED